MKSFRTGIIGCGNMGGAVARGLIRKGVSDTSDIFLNDRIEERAVRLSMETGCVFRSLTDLIKGSDIIVIAVKPQDSGELLDKISPEISSQTVVSVMAGVRTGDIVERLGKEIPVARAMPNMGAVVAESMTCIAYGDTVKKKEEVKSIFSGIGAVLEISESDMDAVTALSGSGPAYLFYLAEAMIEAGIELGLEGKEARKLVKQTLYGAGSLLKEAGIDPKELIEKVASRGGTTEAALSVLKEKSVKFTLKTAIRKAKERSRELSEGRA